MSVVAVDIGGTKIAAAVVAVDGIIEARRSVPTPSAAGPGAVLDAVESLVRDLGGGIAVGVGSAGVVDPLTGTIASATEAIRDWTGTPVRSELCERLGVPVAVVNDVHAHAAGESTYGAGRRAASMLFVAAGTGIGGAWTVDGRVVAGARGVAGHVGHIPVAAAAGRVCTCGGTGHVEAVAAGPPMTGEYRRRSNRAAQLDDIAAAAESGDDTAAAVLREGGTALGSAVGGLVNVLDAEVVVLGGGVAASGPVWWSAVNTAVAAELLPAVRGTPVLPSTLGANAPLLGAALMARAVLA